MPGKAVYIGLYTGGFLLLVLFVADPALRPAFFGVFVLLVLALGWGHLRYALTMREVLAVAVVLRLIAFAMPSSLSDDYHRYLWDGYVQTEGINPYARVPSDTSLTRVQELIPSVYAPLNSKDYYSVYPPLSQLLFRWSWIGGSAQAAYWLYKFFALLVEGLGIWLLARLLAPRWMMLYVWFPFVLIELVGQAHTEVFAVTLLISAYYATRNGSAGLAGLCIGLATWVKIYPILFLPFLVTATRDGRAIVGFLLAGVVWLPYYDGFVWEHVFSSLRLYYNLFEFNAGLYLGLKQVLWWLDGVDYSKSLGPLFSLGFAMSGLLLFLLALARRLRFETGIYGVLLLYYLFATTIHPWYLTLVLPFIVLRQEVAPWYFLCTASTGTYLFYTHGIYWPFVWGGWGGFLLLWSLHHRTAVLSWLMQARARSKVEQLLPHLPLGPCSVLDIGAAEGLVGAQLAQRGSTNVSLIDVVDMNQSGLPLTLYDGERLPYPDQTFDVVLLIYVLHHAGHPKTVLREALRVAKKKVIILESTTDSKPRYAWTRFLDLRVNRWRSGGIMTAQEEDLAFHTSLYWARLLQKMGWSCVQQRSGGLLDRKTLYVAVPDRSEDG